MKLEIDLDFSPFSMVKLSTLDLSLQIAVIFLIILFGTPESDIKSSFL
ncbi:uncharacterized protein METZ01_LOCUS160668 [marine metagenome]|uniref:Uncharacterized protein n=1 Tax=marine metagenome TaxID=408172 RepID=A0A382B2I3_9ZZZZ